MYGGEKAEGHCLKFFLFIIYTVCSHSRHTQINDFFFVFSLITKNMNESFFYSNHKPTLHKHTTRTQPRRRLHTHITHHHTSSSTLSWSIIKIANDTNASWKLRNFGERERIMSATQCKLMEAATFYPNAEEFENPMEYVRGIFQEANST